MKMSPEHFNILKTAINKALKLHYMVNTFSDLVKVYEQHKIGVDYAKRARWDLLWLAKKEKLIPERFVVDELYPYIDDTHIDSALKAIVKSL